jgi:hypothetical protein
MQRRLGFGSYFIGLPRSSSKTCPRLKWFPGSSIIFRKIAISLPLHNTVIKILWACI